MPIGLTPGRGGAAPQISLSYDTAAGNGPFGMGWTLSTPSITRKTDKGLPRYLDHEDSDTFLLFGMEDLTPAVDSSGAPVRQVAAVYGKRYRLDGYRPRVEGAFALIERWTPLAGDGAPEDAAVFWRVTDRNNVTSWFGRDVGTRVHDPDDPSRVFQWLLCETSDDRGNVARYEYKAEDGEGVDRTLPFESNRACFLAGAPVAPHAARYLKRIRYGNRNPHVFALSETGPEWPRLPVEDFMFEAIFDYGEHSGGADTVASVSEQRPWTVRPDAFSTHRGGFEIRNWRLCCGVLMVHHFPDDPAVGRDALVSVTRLDYTFDGDERQGRAGLATMHRAQCVDCERVGGSLQSRPLPPITFGFSAPAIDPMPGKIAADALEGLPVGTHGARLSWIDLDGEGLSGVLSDEGGTWRYARNLGNGRFAAMQTVPAMPAAGPLDGGAWQLSDVDGDGRLELCSYEGGSPGYFSRRADGQWGAHRPFENLPALDWRSPDLRFADLTGDGTPDVVEMQGDVLTWRRSLDRRGFDAARRIRLPDDAAIGPQVAAPHPLEALVFADMTGDGLPDLVRVRATEICYWPNLGFGRWGRRVVFADAPDLGRDGDFDPRRIRLADVDGSGTCDLIVLDRTGAGLFRNLSGNSFGARIDLRFPVATENLDSVQVSDLFGDGTACLVWNSHLPADARTPLRYLRLMREGKPHLLTRIDNGRGMTTDIDYTPSTEFYLADRAAGRPWATRLPFPVQCVSRIAVEDRWRESRLATRYSYHHGHFDGEEREFRGFTRVDQVDTETFGDPGLDQPPVLSVTWFHTGADDPDAAAAIDAEFFPARYADALARGGGGAGERAALAPVLPDDLAPSERRDAVRALKGLVLRQELYELAPSPGGGVEANARRVKLFGASATAYRLSAVQRATGTSRAVFLPTPCDSLSYHYELDLTPADAGQPLDPDPRITQELVLRHGPFGDPLQKVMIAYPRRSARACPTPEATRLAATVHGEWRFAYAEYAFTTPLVTPASGVSRHHRAPMPCEARTYSLEGPRLVTLLATGPDHWLSRNSFAAVRLGELYGPIDTTTPPLTIPLRPYADMGGAGEAWRRLVDHACILYYDDASDTTGPRSPLPFGQHGPRGLKYEDYRLALTGDLLAKVIGADRLDAPTPVGPRVRDLLGAPEYGGYVPSPLTGDAAELWQRSGRMEFSADAPLRFFLPDRHRSAFGAVTEITYGPAALYIAALRDSVGNTVRVAAFDNRVQAPSAMIDASGNRTEVAFDIHRAVVATAAMGKRKAGRWEGDDLSADAASFTWRNPEVADVRAYCTAADVDEAQARRWLGGATTRFVSDHGGTTDATGDRWGVRAPAVVAIARERYLGQLAPGEESPVQISLAVTDGAGQPLMEKLRAEPDPSTGAARFVVTGLVQLNNKGKPVRVFEPAFSPRFGPEPPRANGVSTTTSYDALGRAVRTAFPDGSLARAVFAPWDIVAYDRNDTVLDGTWLEAAGRDAIADTASLRPDGGPAAPSPEEIAGWCARRHAGTPTWSILDVQGQPVITIAHNRVPGAGANVRDPATWSDSYALTYTHLDPEGRPLFVREAGGRIVTQMLWPPMGVRDDAIPAGTGPTYDLSGTAIFQHSMDAGSRWSLADAAGQPLLAWDVNTLQDDAGDWWDERRLYVHVYDAMRRPLARWLTASRRRRGTTGAFTADAPVLLERFVYQDGVADDPRNLNGQLVAHRDASGLTELARRSFAGRSEHVLRTPGRDHRARFIDWSGPLVVPDPRLEAEVYGEETSYDALGRMTRHASGLRAGRAGPVRERTYNARGLLARERLTLSPGGPAIDVVAEIRYDAKGQKTFLRRGGSTESTYTHDPATFRLTRLVTRRVGDRSVMQDLSYTYDPVGNVVCVIDAALDTVFFRNAQVKPVTVCIHDALYRLIEANGREFDGPPGPDTPEGSWPFSATPSDATLRRYRERYVHDASGNLLRLEHRAGTRGSFTRRFETEASSNRLVRSWIGGSAFAGSPPGAMLYAYDSHGNMLNLVNGPARFRWDHRDMIAEADLGGGGRAFYQYANGKQRSRKTIKRQGSERIERLYLGGYESCRRWRGSALIEETESWHVLESEERLLLVEVVTASDTLPLRTNLRFQLGNHLGSVAAEVDEAGRLISYEEYHPYGTSAYRRMHGDPATRAPARRYRYTGMERDEETALSYHGARYLAPWLGRWISADPIGIADGPNVYAYARQGPSNARDRGGTATDDMSKFYEFGKKVEGYFATFLRAQGIEFKPQVSVENGSSVLDFVLGNGKTVSFEIKAHNISNYLDAAGELDIDKVTEYFVKHQDQGIRHIFDSGTKEIRLHFIQGPKKFKDQIDEMITYLELQGMQLYPPGKKPAGLPDVLGFTLEDLYAFTRKHGGEAAALAKKIAQSEGSQKLLKVVKSAPGLRYAVALMTFGGIASNAQAATLAAREGDTATALAKGGEATLDAVAETPTPVGMVVSAGQTGWAAGELLSWSFGIEEYAQTAGDRTQTELRKLGLSADAARNAGAFSAALHGIAAVPFAPLVPILNRINRAFR